MSDKFNSSICKYFDVDEICSFCALDEATAPFYCDCTITNKFGVDLRFFIFNSTNMTYSLILKDIYFFITKPKIVIS